MKTNYLAIGRSAFLGLTAALFAMLASVASATTYYVDSTGGNDGNAGTTTVSPWKTLSKVSSITYAAGDNILFLKDRQFTGTLTLNGNGSSGSKITIDSYGTGANKPVIIGDETLSRRDLNGAIKLINRSWWVIQNIEVQAPSTNGLCMAQASNVTVQNVDFTNIKYQLQGTAGTFGENGMGITMVDGTLGTYTPCVNVTVNSCTFKKVHNGVWEDSVDNCIVQNCYFSDIHDYSFIWGGNTVGNGHSHPCTNSRFTSNVLTNPSTNTNGWNIMMFGGTDNCYAELNEIRYGRPATASGGVDHQVWDFDTRCLNSYIQYNYTHDNYDALFFNYFLGGATENGGCVYRYNLSVGDAEFRNHPSYTDTYGLQVYNNTFFKFKGTAGRNPIAADLPNATAKNNIYYMNSVLSGTWSNPTGSSNNLYFHATAPAGESGSINADPQLVWGPNPPDGLQITSGSPARNAGTAITNNGGRDWWGNTWTGTSYPGGAADIGANEYTGIAGPPKINMALHAAVSTTTSVENWGWFRTCLVDGESNSIGIFPSVSMPGAMGWSSTNYTTATPGTPETIQLDLAVQQTFNKVILFPRNDDTYQGDYFPVDFTIQTSTNNSTWTTQVTQTNYTKPGNQGQVFTFGPVTAQWVKVVVTKLRGSGTNYGVALAEFEVRNDANPVPPALAPIGNKALAKVVTASSSVEDWGWSRADLTDGQRNSVTSVTYSAGPPEVPGSHGTMGLSTVATGSNHTEWVWVDLGAVASISEVDLYPRNDSPYVGEGFPIDFTIQTSTDNITWTTQVTKTGYGKPSTGQSFPFLAINARYVKVNATNLRPLGGSYGLALAEMEVY